MEGEHLKSGRRALQTTETLTSEPRLLIVLCSCTVNTGGYIVGCLHEWCACAVPSRKPDAGIKYLVAGQFVDDRPSSVARFLLTRKGLSKQMIGDYLGNLQRPFNMEVLRYTLHHLDVTVCVGISCKN